MIAESDLEGVVRSVPGVLGCHHIRTRGPADHVFLDLHVWLPASMTETYDSSRGTYLERVSTRAQYGGYRTFQTSARIK